MWWMNTVPILLEQHNSVIYVCISILQFKSTLFLVLMLHCMHFVFRGFSATQVRTHSELKSIEPFVSNVMKSHRLSDPFLAQIILLRGEVHLSIQLPVPSRSNVLKQCVCACVWESEPASVGDPQRLYNSVLLMLTRVVLLSISESSNHSRCWE